MRALSKARAREGEELVQGLKEERAQELMQELNEERAEELVQQLV